MRKAVRYSASRCCSDSCSKRSRVLAASVSVTAWNSGDRHDIPVRRPRLGWVAQVGEQAEQVVHADARLVLDEDFRRAPVRAGADHAWDGFQLGHDERLRGYGAARTGDDTMGAQAREDRKSTR